MLTTLCSCDDRDSSESPFDETEATRSPFLTEEPEQEELLQKSEKPVQTFTVPSPPPIAKPPPPPNPIVFAGKTSGTFHAPKGPKKMATKGTGTQTFVWGLVQERGDRSCYLNFEGKEFSNEVEKPFLIGKVEFFNGTTQVDTEASSVALKIKLELESGQEAEFDFIFDLIMVVNNNLNRDDDADIVRLRSAYSEKTMKIEGQDYHLRLDFGKTSKGGFSEFEQFFVWENHSASAELRATITAEDPPDIVPKDGEGRLNQVKPPATAIKSKPEKTKIQPKGKRWMKPEFEQE